MDELRYVWNPNKAKRKYHVASATGTVCKLENGIGSLEKLTASSTEKPVDRPACSICEKLVAEAAKRGEKKAGNGISRTAVQTFYSGWEWKAVRYQAIKLYGRKCMCCGATDHIVVDHIKPVRKYPELSLEMSNLQILCDECNRGKSFHDETDWRPDA